MISKRNKNAYEKLIEISKEYKKSLKDIEIKINEKQMQLRENKDKVLDNDLKIMRSIERDLKENIKELENYYKNSYWRNEKITMNARKSIKIYFNVKEML